MRTYTTREARDNFKKMLDDVAAGVPVQITRNKERFSVMLLTKANSVEGVVAKLRELDERLTQLENIPGIGPTPGHPNLERECCSSPTPCKHWTWDAASGDGYINSLSGRLREENQ